VPTTTEPSIIFMGTPPFAAGCLRHLLDGQYHIAGVVTVPDKRAGRGLLPQASAVKTTALEHKLPVLQPESLKEPAFLQALSQWNASLFVVVAFRMLPKEVWQMPRLGCFNLHASLLPMYRGAAPINHVLIQGEKETGLTTFLIDEHMDTGAILLQERIPVEDTDTAGTLLDKMTEAAGPLIAKTIDGLFHKTLRATPQPVLQESMLKTAPKITKETCRINWNRPPAEIVNLIRGLSPAPGAFTVWTKPGTGQPATHTSFFIKIYQARASQTVGTEKPGTVLIPDKHTFKVACKGGYVHILELQFPGKKKMAVDVFLAGFREEGPIRFESPL
jgi:methionyl-tRNA formyltransferase